MNLGKQFKEGLITNNPVLVQVLGMCSTMAITTSFFNGLGMGVAVTVILTLSNVIIAAIRKIVPDKIRIAMFIVVIAGFVTCVDLLIQAFVPALSESLGVFIPLIVVNCIILGRAESFSYKNGVAASFWDGIFQGFGYTVVLMVMCIIREFLGAGTFGGGILNGGDGIQILPEQFPIGMLTLPVGGFLVAFSLRVEAPVTFGDNTAANNVRFLCSDGTELQGPGLTWGDFGNWSELCPKGVCGLQTKIQQPQGLLDDTAINDALFFCCRN